MFTHRPQLPNLNTANKFQGQTLREPPTKEKIEVDLSPLAGAPTFPGKIISPLLRAVSLSAVINSRAPTQVNLSYEDMSPVFKHLWETTGQGDSIYDIVRELQLSCVSKLTLNKVSSWKQLQLALAEGLTVMVGHTVYERFIEAEGSGVVPMPRPGEGLLGGHIVNLVGYNPVTDIATALGNLGGGFGHKGMLTYRGSFLRNLSICFDFFVLVPGRVNVNQ